MFGLKIITVSEYQRLLDDRANFERLFNSERERADRLADEIIQMAGREPVSAPVVQKRERQQDEWEKKQKEMDEICSDVLNGTGTVSEKDELVGIDLSTMNAQIERMLGDSPQVESDLANQASS